MIVRALENDKVPFKPRGEGEEVLGQEYPYLSVIGALMYLANNTRPNIAFRSELSYKTQRGSYNASLEWHQEYLAIFSWNYRSWIRFSEEPRF
jgi:hypothetical protein